MRNGGLMMGGTYWYYVSRKVANVPCLLLIFCSIGSTARLSIMIHRSLQLAAALFSQVNQSTFWMFPSNLVDQVVANDSSEFS